MKQELSSEPVLALFDPDYDSQLHTDASKLGLAGALFQKQMNGHWKPVNKNQNVRVAITVMSLRV